MRLLLLVLTLLFQHRAGPDSLYPPAILNVMGTTNPQVTQLNIHQTICTSNWTKSIRPTTAFTDKLKLTQMSIVGLKGNPDSYEEDHFISLEIGGAPRDPKNLWPEPWKAIGAHQKDLVENVAHRLVCSGKMTLVDAQRRMSTDWYAWYLELQK